MIAIKGISSGVSSLIKLIKNRRTKKRGKKEEEIKRFDLAVINLSGHPLSPKAVETAKSFGKNVKIIEKSIPSVDLTDKNTYMLNVEQFCSEIIKDLIEKEGLLNNLLIGNYIVVQTGMSSIADVFTTMLHGITGHFPFKCYTFKDGMIFDITNPFDHQALRNAFRDSR